MNPKHLYEGTPADNVRDMMERHPKRKGSGHPNAVINEDIARQIKTFRAQGMGASLIGKSLNVPRHTVNNVVNGHCWVHVGLEE